MTLRCVPLPASEEFWCPMFIFAPSLFRPLYHYGIVVTEIVFCWRSLNHFSIFCWNVRLSCCCDVCSYVSTRPLFCIFSSSLFWYPVISSIGICSQRFGIPGCSISSTGWWCCYGNNFLLVVFSTEFSGWFCFPFKVFLLSCFFFSNLLPFYLLIFFCFQYLGF